MTSNSWTAKKGQVNFFLSQNNPKKNSPRDACKFNQYNPNCKIAPLQGRGYRPNNTRVFCLLGGVSVVNDKNRRHKDSVDAFILLRGCVEVLGGV